jgi:hypothetical protein
MTLTGLDGIALIGDSIEEVGTRTVMRTVVAMGVGAMTVTGLGTIVGTGVETTTGVGFVTGFQPTPVALVGTISTGVGTPCGDDITMIVG